MPLHFHDSQLSHRRTPTASAAKPVKMPHAAIPERLDIHIVLLLMLDLFRFVSHIHVYYISRSLSFLISFRLIDFCFYIAYYLTMICSLGIDCDIIDCHFASTTKAALNAYNDRNWSPTSVRFSHAMKCYRPQMTHVATEFGHWRLSLSRLRNIQNTTISSHLMYFSYSHGHSTRTHLAYAFAALTFSCLLANIRRHVSRFDGATSSPHELPHGTFTASRNFFTMPTMSSHYSANFGNWSEFHRVLISFSPLPKG
jgi:hypothetical protein